MTTIHTFDVVSGAYTGNRETGPGERTRFGGIATPGATLLPPPEAPAGQWPRWVGGAWDVVADHRGETWWRADGTPITLSDLGDPSDAGLSPDMPATAVERGKVALCDAIDVRAEAARLAVLPSPGQAAEYDRALVQAQAVLAASDPVPADFPFVSGADAAGLRASALAIVAASESADAVLADIRERRLAAKAAIRAAATMEAAHEVGRAFTAD